MNLDNLQNKLITAARAIPADDRVPYTFEKRVMARLAQGVRVDLLGAWTSALWRGAMACLVVTMLSGAWLLWSNAAADDSDFARDFDTAVFASANSADEAW